MINIDPNKGTHHTVTVEKDIPWMSEDIHLDNLGSQLGLARMIYMWPWFGRVSAGGGVYVESNKRFRARIFKKYKTVTSMERPAGVSWWFFKIKRYLRVNG